MSPRLLRLAAAGLGFAALVGCHASGDRPGSVLFPDMFQSLSYKPYDPNPLLAGGQTLQLPPEGTVPMERASFLYGIGADEAIRAGRELRNPMAPTAANRKRGRKVYETICIVCHGPQGQGDGPIIGRFPNPPSLLADRAKRLPDGQVFHIISRGQGIMPSHAAQVLPDDRWRAILHLRQLQDAPPGPVNAPAPAAAGGAS
jgi:mono/diheme cytochrome c family protein